MKGCDLVRVVEVKSVMVKIFLGGEGLKFFMEVYISHVGIKAGGFFKELKNNSEGVQDFFRGIEIFSRGGG